MRFFFIVGFWGSAKCLRKWKISFIFVVRLWKKIKNAWLCYHCFRPKKVWGSVSQQISQSLMGTPVPNPYLFFFTEISNLWTHTAPRVNILFTWVRNMFLMDIWSFLSWTCRQYVRPKSTLCTHFTFTDTIWFHSAPRGCQSCLETIPLLYSKTSNIVGHFFYSTPQGLSFFFQTQKGSASPYVVINPQTKFFFIKIREIRSLTWPTQGFAFFFYFLSTVRNTDGSYKSIQKTSGAFGIMEISLSGWKQFFSVWTGVLEVSYPYLFLLIPGISLKLKNEFLQGVKVL